MKKKKKMKRLKSACHYGSSSELLDPTRFKVRNTSRENLITFQDTKKKKSSHRRKDHDDIQNQFEPNYNTNALDVDAVNIMVQTGNGSQREIQRRLEPTYLDENQNRGSKRSLRSKLNGQNRSSSNALRVKAAIAGSQSQLDANEVPVPYFGTR